MRTTVRLDQALLERVRAEAAKRKTTLTSLIEQGLELVLRQPTESVATAASRATRVPRWRRHPAWH
jgi:predicted DNA-binding ribbon-helix-helix protein